MQNIQTQLKNNFIVYFKQIAKFYSNFFGSLQTQQSNISNYINAYPTWSSQELQCY